jgi:hypothetical protein
MEKHLKTHLLNMIKILLPSIFTVFLGFGQSSDSLLHRILNDCEKNFSMEKIDSTFCNFYIKDFKDTVFFKHDDCILQAQTTSPLTFKRRIQNGYANGFLRIYTENTDSYSWLDGYYVNGSISSGSYLEYYQSGKLKLSGQFINGHRQGVWTWYFENGNINRLFVYEIAEPIKEIEYDMNGKIIDEYDFVDEKNNANTH